MPRLAKPLAALLALSTLVACGTKSDQKAADSSAAAAAVAAQPKSLYDRLGGTTAIASVVDAFVANVASDARINKRFTRVAKDTAAMRQFKQKLVDQICQGSGGPCTYTGKDMKTAHQGMGLTGADFDALVGDLVKALDGAGVPQKEKDDLLAVLGPMRADIVTK
jgi:hemoglobin